MTVRYDLPQDWIRYDARAIVEPLTSAKAAILALTQMPFQRSWADELQKLQLKREVAGTSRIEGAEFTEKELDDALTEAPGQLQTRSQRQAAAALAAYRWIAELPADRPIDKALIFELHRRLVTGCDDDHCPPGQLRTADQNVTFGTPRHRGVDGGESCAKALEALLAAAHATFKGHDALVRALALHYHLAAMHPFLDGNGRTARALEALLLQRLGLRDTLFIAMSNHYYEEKTAYLQALADTRAGGHDLTPFLVFALRGVELQCRGLFAQIRQHIVKALYRNTARDLFGRLKSPRKRVISKRHLQILNLVLDEGEISLLDLVAKTAHFYALKNPQKALLRDLNYLLGLNAIVVPREPLAGESVSLAINLEWPEQITETEFFKRVKNMPKGKVLGFLST